MSQHTSPVVRSEQRLISLSPLFWIGFTLTCTLVTFMFYRQMLGAGVADGTLLTLTLIIFSLCFGVTMVAVKMAERENASGTVKSLGAFYINIALIYALVYVAAHALSGRAAFIAGLHDELPLSVAGDAHAVAHVVSIATGWAMLFIDALCYSVLTMTGLGDAQVQPRFWVRFIVASQTGVTFAATVFALARAFAGAASQESGARHEALMARLDGLQGQLAALQRPAAEEAARPTGVERTAQRTPLGDVVHAVASLFGRWRR